MGDIEQVVRAPCLSEEPAYHSRITGDLLIAALLDRQRENQNLTRQTGDSPVHRQVLRLIWRDYV